jgi:putative ABC transport system permease protein
MRAFLRTSAAHAARVVQPLHLQAVMLDLRYAFRQLVGSPGFTAVALLTLTLGMGANTAFFSLLYGVVLRQPAYPAAERIMTIHNLWAGEPGNGGMLSRAEFRDYEERQRAFEGIAASDLGRMTLTSSGDRDAFAERVKVSHVTANLFPILGVSPERGRGTRAGDERGGPVAVVSHEVWRSRFGGGEDILERTIRLNGDEYDIIGVMPAGFAYPEAGMAAWVPIDIVTPRGESDRGDHYLAVIGRLASGTSIAKARLDLQRAARELQHDLPAAYQSDARWSIGAASLRERQFGRMLAPLGLLMAAASAVLLIACVNVAIMSLLRALARRREISIRFAIGAARRDVMRQLMTEAAVLCALGAAGGLFVARVALGLLKAFAPGDIPRLQEAGINVTTALFTSGVLVVVTLLVGLAPAVVALRMNAFEGGFRTGRSSDSRTTTRLRDTLTVMEIALAAALLVCAGLTLRSLQALVRVDLGFATEHRFSFKTNLTERDYPDAARVDRFYEQLTARLESLPGTESIGAVSYLPLSGEGQSVAAAPADAIGGRDVTEVTVGWGIVRGRYFETMDVALVGGRLFSVDDRPGSPPVAIVDDTLARRLWASEAAAIGRPVRFGAGSRAETRTIVGVVHHVSHDEPGRASLPMAYAPQSQVYQRGMYTVISTTSAPQALMSAVRAALAAVDASVPMYFAETVNARYDSALALPRFTAGLVGAFSTLALVLAGVGIFGVTGYAVAQRTREFGIRVALGAQRSHVGALVLRRVGLLASLGLALGGALGRGLGSLMSGILFGVEPDDPLTLIVAMGAIGVTAILASFAPLRHAVLVSPAETLRAE